MKLTPRGDEKAYAQQLLDNEETTPNDVIKYVAGLISLRDWVIVACDNGLNFGPFTSEADARKFISTLDFGGKARIYSLFSPERYTAEVQGDPELKGQCSNCGHSPYLHRMRGEDGNNAKGACGLSTCPCERFKKVS